MRCSSVIVSLLSLVSAPTLLFAGMVHHSAGKPRLPGTQRPVLGDPEVVRQKYEVWKQANNDSDTLDIGLFWSKGLSRATTDAYGKATLVLATGSLSVEAYELPPETPMDVWLVHNVPGAGRSVRPEAGDHIVHAGTLVRDASRASLDVVVKDFAIDGQDLDLIVVAPAGSDPGDGGILYGTPTLFQRLWVAEKRQAASPSSGGGLGLLSTLSLVMLAVPPAPPMFDDLVARGEFLFFNERFNGNGRTCGTCHRTENNLTIDPSFIDDLPNNDPLFVAEFIDALNFDRNGGKRFENPVLMRALGLIAENQDGFGDLGKRFTMRGVPHVFAQTVSIRAPQGGIRPPNDRTGWGGDGAPFGQIGNLQTFGTLRDFAVGAVIQHFPLTLNRQINVDFRLPTDAELDALEAFQLSTGRQVDLELRDGHTNTLILRDANADTGRLLFRDGIPPNGSFTCNNCHFNAGANLSNGENFNFNTGVEQFRINHPDPFGEPRPIDGGFGRAPDGTFPDPPIPNPDGSFGNRTFNTASVVEMADTLPAFHNNIVNTVEEAVLFYQSPEFQQAFGITIPFNAVQVVQVSQFLRVINSLDNIDNSAVRFCKRAIDALGPTISNNDTVNKLLRFAIADLDDTIAVLQSGNLHLQSQQNLRDAKQFLEAAMAPTKASVRIDRINKALELIKQARSLMVING